MFYEMLLGGGQRQGVRVLSEQSVHLMTSRQRVGMMDVTFKHVVDWGLGTIIDSKRYGIENGSLRLWPLRLRCHFRPRRQPIVGRFCRPGSWPGRGLLFQRHAGRDGPSEAAAPRARRAVRGFGPGVSGKPASGLFDKRNRAAIAPALLQPAAASEMEYHAVGDAPRRRIESKRMGVAITGQNAAVRPHSRENRASARQGRDVCFFDGCALTVAAWQARGVKIPFPTADRSNR